MILSAKLQNLILIKIRMILIPWNSSMLIIYQITMPVTFSSKQRQYIIWNNQLMRKDFHLVKFLVHNLEAFIWITVIIYFAVSPMPTGDHFTICPLKLAGFEHCPGCGLGRSLILLLHGRIIESINMHPLAIFALPVFATRIVMIFRNYYKYRIQLSANEHVN